MRSVIHPGAPAAERIPCVSCAGQRLEVSLQAGIPLDQSVAAALRAGPFTCAWLAFDNAPVESLSYVIPAYSPDDEHVAWYSAPYGFGAGCIDTAGMIVGWHHGECFTHCHGLWTAGNATRQAMGHLLADQTVLSEPAKVSLLGLTGARFDRRFDTETQFELFHVDRMSGERGDYAVLRILPNQDLTLAARAACDALGWSAARIHGIGSLIGAQFDDGRVLESLPTEFLLPNAIVGGAAPPPEIAIVGVDGGDVVQGRLAVGENPVLVTAEIVMNRLAGD